MQAPEITTEVDTPESRELMARCDRVNEAMVGLTGGVGTPTDMGMWADALAIVAGSYFGLIHQQLGVSENFDDDAAEAIVYNVMQAIKIGRAEALKMAREKLLPPKIVLITPLISRSAWSAPGTKITFR